jgi:Domain of unknown function (DUF4091)
MERIGRTVPPATEAEVKIWAARGEYEPFQIVVSAGAKAANGVNLQASDLIGPKQCNIAAGSFTFYREHYVQINRSSPDPGHGNRPLGPGLYADALVPFVDPEARRPTTGSIPSAPFDVSPNTNQPVWVDLHVPSDAKPGSYSGTVRVLSSQGERRIAISLHVWGFSLPLKPALKSSFGMHEPALSDRRVHQLLLEHRVMPVSVNSGDVQEFQEKLGLNTSALRFWGNSNRTNCTMDPPPSPTAIATELEHFPRNLPVYIYPADEIDRCPNLFATVRSWAARTRAVDPRIKNLVTVSPVSALYDDGEKSGRSAVDIWTLLPKAYESSRTQTEFVKAKGDEVWSYTALVQDDYSPKWEIDFAPINYRILPGFLSQSLGLTGLLYWRIDLWTASPWQDVYGYRIDGNVYPGEGMLVYPGSEAGVSSVVPSMRLKWIREGVEDYEYVALLKQLGRGDWALARVRGAASDWRSWSRDATAVESVRRELGDEIERLSSASGRTSHEANPN